MSYVLEFMSEHDKPIIVHDAQKKFANLYAARGGHFRAGRPCQWVVDRERNSYLIDAPTLAATLDGLRPFHFYFAGEMYAVQLVGSSQTEILVAEPPTGMQRPSFEAALIQALEIFGYRFVRFPNKAGDGF